MLHYLPLRVKSTLLEFFLMILLQRGLQNKEFKKLLILAFEVISLFRNKRFMLILIHGFSYPKNMANFEAFHWVISSSTNLLFLKSDHSICTINFHYTFFPFLEHCAQGNFSFIHMNLPLYVRLIFSHFMDVI